MKTIDIVIPGNPIALKRHRMTKRGHSYDPSKNDKADFLAKCMQKRPETPISGPIKIDLLFIFPRPKAHHRGTKAVELKPNAPKYHTSRPDADNLIKFVADSLNGIFWKDDSQLCIIEASKVYGESGKIIMTIEEIL